MKPYFSKTLKKEITESVVCCGHILLPFTYFLPLVLPLDLAEGFLSVLVELGHDEILKFVINL